MNEMEEVKVEQNVNNDLEQKFKDTLNRIDELNNARKNVEKYENELKTRISDLESVKKLKGEQSEEYTLNSVLVENTRRDLEYYTNKVSELSFKRSEMKEVFDYVTKKFSDELRKEQETEYSIEIGNKQVSGNKSINTGVKAYKQLMEYLYHGVNWDAKTAVALMVLVKNMEENKLWVRSNQFDNVIKLRSANVMVLYRSILEQMTGRGYETAKDFLECWSNCGLSITNAVKEINKKHESTRQLGFDLNKIETEYNISENDLGEDDSVESIEEEVAPSI